MLRGINSKQATLRVSAIALLHDVVTVAVLSADNTMVVFGRLEIDVRSALRMTVTIRDTDLTPRAGSWIGMTVFRLAVSCTFCESRHDVQLMIAEAEAEGD